MEASVKPKYLNSPETELFHKGSVLFNHHRARKAAHDSGEVIVVEGYVDVIAMTQAGFPHTVAPLGTALTGEQCELLWRMAGEPILCFDGDKAGQKAAFRAIDMALPLIGPGRSLRFALLPEGQDPDDLARSGGPAAIGRVARGGAAAGRDAVPARDRRRALRHARAARGAGAAAARADRRDRATRRCAAITGRICRRGWRTSSARAGRIAPADAPAAAGRRAAWRPDSFDAGPRLGIAGPSPADAPGAGRQARARRRATS